MPKGDIHSLLAPLNHHLVTALGACGDVVRNITCYPAPLADRPRADVGAYAQETARRFRPRTQAYYQLWLDGERAVTAEAPGEEPLYGTTYLPPKFKIGFAFPGDNCIDVYSNDIGVVPVLDGESLRSFTVLVGGGMGRNHTNPDTFPRLADPLTTVAPQELLEVLDTIVRVQRDHGDRLDREHVPPRETAGAPTDRRPASSRSPRSLLPLAGSGHKVHTQRPLRDPTMMFHPILTLRIRFGVLTRHRPSRPTRSR